MNTVHKEQIQIKGEDMYVMVSSVETSISLSEKIQIISVNLLSKPLKRKVYTTQQCSAKIATVTLLKGLVFFFFQFLEFLYSQNTRICLDHACLTI